MNQFLNYAQHQEEVAALKYKNELRLERLKELAEMYKNGGFFEIYYALMFAVKVLEAET